MIRISISFLVAGVILHAQWVGSGSNGSDGVLRLLAPGTVGFDAATLSLRQRDDNVYNFTSVYIGKGVTVTLSAQKTRGPVFWLVQGTVIVDGRIDLNGADGEVSLPSIPGAGGFPGGAASKPGYTPSPFIPNEFLVPLVGGFGGDGSSSGGGGAGGGAILIASSTSITVNGAVTANGGASSGGFGGGGGAIRLVAPMINGDGMIDANGGQPGGTPGLVRFEATTNRFTGNLNNTPLAVGRPYGLYLPRKQPSVRVTRIQTNTVPMPGTSPVSVTVFVEARFVPVGTILELELFAEDGTSESVTTTPLAGTFERSSATATLAARPGSPVRIVQAEWRRSVETGPVH